MKGLVRAAGAILILAAILSACAPPPALTPASLPPAPTSPPVSIPASSPTPLRQAATRLPALSATPWAIELTSPAFEPEAPIPERHACHGANVSPPLAWSEPPPGTQSLALVMDDPDAVAVVGSVWDHWVLFNLPAEARALPEGVLGYAELPDGSRHGLNSSNRPGYSGPCPPGGQTHRYVFTLYALDTTLALDAQTTKADLLQAMQGNILAQAQLVGSYTSP